MFQKHVLYWQPSQNRFTVDHVEMDKSRPKFQNVGLCTRAIRRFDLPAFFFFRFLVLKLKYQYLGETA